MPQSLRRAEAALWRPAKAGAQRTRRESRPEALGCWPEGLVWRSSFFFVLVVHFVVKGERLFLATESTEDAEGKQAGGSRLQAGGISLEVVIFLRALRALRGEF